MIKSTLIYTVTSVLIAGAIGMAAGNPVVSIVPTPSIPLQVDPSGVNTAPMPGGYQQLGYELVNLSSKRLIAVEVTWMIKYADGRRIGAHSRKLYLFNVDGDLVPRNSAKLYLGIPLPKGNPVRVDSITGQVTFAELADGTTFGSDQKLVLAWIDDSYRARVQAAQTLLAAYRGQGPAGLMNMLNTNSSSDSLVMHATKEMLTSVEQKSGLSAVIARINRDASTALPPARPAGSD